MKFFISIVISLSLFLLFRRNHEYTVKTWLYLFLIHAPVPALLFTLEKTRKLPIHPIVCFLGVWSGGLVLGFLFGPLLISILGGRR